MSKLIRSAWLRFARLAAIPCAIVGALPLGGCDVQVHDETPEQYTANYGTGMYEIKASVQRDSMISPDSVYLFALGPKQRIPLISNPTGTEWHAEYSVRCRSTFPLQILAVWKVQGLTTKEKVVPEQPRQIKLIEPPLTQQASIDTSGARGKTGWEGSVKYTFATAPTTQITAAHIEPDSPSPADVAAAKPISIVSSLPVDAACGAPTEVQLASTAQRAHGTLVIDTDLPPDPHWSTKVEFVPK